MTDMTFPIRLLYAETIINSSIKGNSRQEFLNLLRVTKFNSAAMRDNVKRSERCRTWPIACGDCKVDTVLTVVDQRTFCFEK